jgi:hypothetical protein
LLGEEVIGTDRRKIGGRSRAHQRLINPTLQHSSNSVELIPDRDDNGDGDGCGDSNGYEYYNDYFDGFGYYDGYDLQFVLACVRGAFQLL